MVCAKCAKKESSLACTDVWKPAGKGADERGSDRKVGENKLLASKKKMKVMPYMVKDSYPAKNGSSSAASSSSKGGSSLGGTSSCKKCKSKVAKVGASYCQGCAYKDSLCAMCGVPVMSGSMKAQYKMTSK